MHYIALVQGIVGTGGIFAGTNPAYTPLELTHHLKITAAKFIISEPELLPQMLTAAKSLGIPESRILVFHPLRTQKCPADLTSYLSLLEHGEADWMRFSSPEQSKSTTACRLTSSGTTGLPKACINTHFNLIAEHELNYAPAYYQKPYDVRHQWALPMFHAAVAPRALFSSFKLGEVAYIMRRFDVEAFARNIGKYQVTELYMVPPIAVGLMMSPWVQTGEASLRSIRAAVVGAAPLTKESQQRLKSYLGRNATFTQGYGMTESNCLIAAFEYPEDDDTGSVGYFRPGTELKLVDEEGNDISGYDVVGEMCVRGPLIIPGYFNADGENGGINRKDWDADGFYHSGDMMYCDGKTKKWYIVDRKKELIKVRGYQVAPPELEGLILQMKGVIDCAVIGVKDKDGEGEVPRAYVIRQPGYSPEVTENEVKDFVRNSLASFKRLDGGVRFVQSIPKTASGKILKRVLRDAAKAEGVTQAAKV